jgi:3-oxoadipate enol-lactonase
VIRYDARGHGRSSVPTGDYTIDDLGRDALAVLDAAAVQAAHVCGLSLGGITAQWLAINAPDRVTSLVLANTAARIATVEAWTQRIALVHEQGMAAAAEQAMQRWFSPAFRERDPDTVHAFRALVQAVPADGYLGCCAALRDADLRERVGAIRCPTLAIASTADIATPPEGLEFIRDRIQGSRLVLFDSGHLSNVECPAEFSAAVTGFLEKKWPGSQRGGGSQAQCPG